MGSRLQQLLQTQIWSIVPIFDIGELFPIKENVYYASKTSMYKVYTKALTHTPLTSYEYF